MTGITASSTGSRCACSPIAAVAEDVTQGGLFEALEQSRSFVSGKLRGVDSSASRAIAPSTCCARAPRVPRASFPSRCPPSDSLEDRALAGSNAESVRDALEKLPAEQRELIELGFFGGATHHEIARSTGLPSGRSRRASGWITAAARRARRSGRRMTSHDEMLDNVAVYALGVLPPAEASAGGRASADLRGVSRRIRSSCGLR